MKIVWCLSYANHFINSISPYVLQYYYVWGRTHDYSERLVLQINKLLFDISLFTGHEVEDIYKGLSVETITYINVDH